MLRTGLKGCSALELAEEILQKFGTVEALSRATVSQLAQIKGVGQTKAIQLAAAFALGSRLSASVAESEPMNQPKVVYQFLGEEMRRLSHESVRVIVVNTKCRLIAVEEISRGTVNEALVHPREVLRPVIQRQAYGFVLVHNHPSGDPEPSLADRQLTTSLKAAAELMQLRFVDHLIIGSPRDGGASYYSFQENGHLTPL